MQAFARIHRRFFRARPWPGPLSSLKCRCRYPAEKQPRREIIVLQRFWDLVRSIFDRSAELAGRSAARARTCLTAARGALVALAILGVAGFVLYRNPPVQNVG